MVAAVWDRGDTATLEYTDRQSRVKVRYAVTDLVLVAVRDRQTGVCACGGSMVSLRGLVGSTR